MEGPQERGLREKVAYRWLLLHRPKIGLIRLRWQEDDIEGLHFLNPPGTNFYMFSLLVKAWLYKCKSKFTIRRKLN